MAAAFIHLRMRTAYSLLEGAIPPKKLAGLCEKAGMPAVGITDSGNLFGALELSESLVAKGIQPIIGCTLALETGLDSDGLKAGPAPRRKRLPQIALLAQNEKGYQNLMELSSRSYFRESGPPEPHVTLEDLAELAEGLIGLTGGPQGPVNRFLVEGQDAKAQAILDTLEKTYPGRLYVELERHGLAEEIRAEPLLVDLAYARGLPLVATNEPYFPAAEDYGAHDALLCIAEGSYVFEEDRRRLSPEHYFKSAETMAALFADVPEAVRNTGEIAQRCAFRPKTRQPILPRFAGSEEEEAAELKRQAHEGLAARLGAGASAASPEAYRERLDFELQVIEGMKFPGYFLIVADFIQWAKAQGIPVGPGRGSGAGSLVAYALTITDLDPLRFGLLFERFLNPERVSMPDFDIDFCQDRRDEVIRYVQGKYGRDRVAQIITFGSLQARAALRDVGRVLGLPYGQVDRLCKLVPQNPAHPVSLAEAIAGEPKLQEAGADDENVARLLEVAQTLEGLYRHASTHAAGVVIADRPLSELVPLYRDPRSDMPVTQFSMKWAEAAGLVKFDFLGLKTLTVLDVAVKLLAQRGISIDLSQLPLDDRATYELLGSGEASGVFQLESSGMRDALKRMKPDSIEDIIALVALYRPGPMDNIPLYIDRKQDRQTPDYLHEKLEPILKETYGVIIYQEQVMQIAQVLSGYSLGEADLLRRAMGKKIKSEMDKQMARFVEGAVERGVPRARAAFIFELVEKFAGYGFNKSHAAAYALVAYQTAYLKANHPVEFMAATMTLDISNTDKLNLFRQELGRLGIEVLPPDVNASEAVFSVEAGKVRYALGALKNVGAQAMALLASERRANGPFASVFDFAARLGPQVLNRRALENLIKAGAFDKLNPNRAQLLAAIDMMMARAGSAAAERESQQVSLFGGPGAESREPALRPAEPFSPLDKLAQEFDAVGFYLSGHPLDDYRRVLERARVSTIAELLSGRGGSGPRVRLAGVVLRKQERRAKSGARFAFVEFSDPTGRFEAVVFSDILSAARDLLEPGTAVVVTADAEREAEGMKLRVQAVEPIDKVAGSVGGGLRVYIDEAGAVEGVQAKLAAADPGKDQIVFVVRQPPERREIEVSLMRRLSAGPKLRMALKALPGVHAVEEM
jgi:DNA polymerase III subunit alpha